MFRPKIVWLAAVVVLVAVACGDAGTDNGNDAPSQGMGPGISVSEAKAADSEGPFLINGYLFVAADRTVVLAEAIAESYPPQPGGAQLTVVGLDLGEFDLTEDQGIAWTDEQIQVLGSVDGDTLRVSSTSSA